MGRLLVSALLFLGSVLSAGALEPPKSQSAVILTVTGAIGTTNAPNSVRLDPELFRSLGWQEIESYNYFLEGKHRFGGVPLRSLIDAVGDGSRIKQVRATALDGYAVVIPASDIARYDIFIAMEFDGEPMRIRNRGPLWIIYPDFDGKPDHDANGRQIWQMTSMVLE